MRLLGWLLAFGTLSCTSPSPPAPAPDAYVAPRTVFPDMEWERARPAAVGLNESVLDSALAYLAQHCRADGLNEVLVLRHGRLVWAGDSIDRVHDIWSCTKSFTATAVGLLAAEEKLRLAQPVAAHEPRLAELYPGATYRHFLTMTSGYNAQGATRWPNDVSEDWSRTPYVPAAPLFAPGTAYAYWDEAMIMLGRALTRVAGQSLNDYLGPRLFTPLSIPQREWWGEGRVTADSVPINFGGTGLRMSASEQARFGLLYLNGGRWRGQQLLPPGWTEEATAVQVPAAIPVANTDRRSTDGSGRYGYNWWVISEPVHAAFTSGLNHNVCLIVPEWDLVLVRMGTDGNPEAGKFEVYSEVLRRLAPGVRVASAYRNSNR